MQKGSGFFLFVLIFSSALLSLTIFHDPILHGAIAMLYGWQITDFNVGILNGYTSITTLTATTLQMWTFYMFPAVFLCSLSFILLYLHPNRLTFIFVLILFILNINSLNPYASGSDAYKASELLSKALLPAEAIHLSIFIFFVLLFAATAYVVVENNTNDANKRLRAMKIKR
jgi:hypothetical protein